MVININKENLEIIFFFIFYTFTKTVLACSYEAKVEKEAFWLREQQNLPQIVGVKETCCILLSSENWTANHLMDFCSSSLPSNCVKLDNYKILHKLLG